MAVHVIEAGSPAYWITYLGETQIFTPCTVVKVEDTASGEVLATFQTKFVQSAGVVGSEVVSRKATRVHVGQRVVVHPTIAFPPSQEA